MNRWENSKQRLKSMWSVSPSNIKLSCLAATLRHIKTNTEKEDWKIQIINILIKDGSF